MMAWIESHQTLRQHPKLAKAARYLGISKVQMIGHLHCLWWWCLDYAQDGDLSIFEPADIAEAAEWEADPADLLHALTDVSRIGDRIGFLERTENGGLLIHDWFDYAGKLIERRERDVQRKRAARGSDTGGTPAGNPMNVRGTSAGHPQDDRGMSDGGPYVPNPTIPNQPNPTEPNTTVPNQPKADGRKEGKELVEPTPEVRAINNAYDACGLMISKTHMDMHLETIARTGLVAWQQGWAAAMEQSKHNNPRYVARCAESAMLAAQERNGKTNGAGSRAAELQPYSMDDIPPEQRKVIESMSVARMTPQSSPLDKLLSWVETLRGDPRAAKMIEREIDRLAASGAITDHDAALEAALHRYGVQASL